MSTRDPQFAGNENPQQSPPERTNELDRPLVILDGIRTPFAKAGGALARVPAEELARQTAREIIARTGLDPSDIDEVIYGCVGQSARAANISRVIALNSGVPESVPAVTVHRNCASGMEAITQAHMQILAGRGECFLVGGTESMSSYPLIFNRRATSWFTRLQRARTLWARISTMLSFRPSFLAPDIALLQGLTDPVHGINMGLTAELVGSDFGVDREAQDEFALASHQKATAAKTLLGEESMLVVSGGQDAVTEDTCVRPEQSMEALGKLRPVFDRKNGSVTAGNACPVTDGAVSLVVGSEGASRRLDMEPLGYLRDWIYVGLDPTRMGLGPAHAMSALFDRTGLGVDDIDLFEINEAFAAQVLGVLEAMKSDSYARDHLGRNRAPGEIPLEKLNVNGGAIALGHPVGASGARLVLTLLMELRRRGLKRGIATLCVGGGQGAALLLETP